MIKAPLIVSGTIFGIVALVHLARLYFQFPIVVGSTSIPVEANIFGFVISAALSLWMFYTAKKV